MLSAASVSALAISSVFAGTGMIIWALIGIAGMLSGLITVGAARRRSRPAEFNANNGPVDAAAKPASVVQESPVTPDNLGHAA